MIDITRRQLISDIAHELVAQIAPQELPLFRVTSKAFITGCEKVIGYRKPDDEMLGFGGDMAISLTPVVLAVTTKVVTFLAEKVTDALKEESGELVTKFVREIFKGISPTEERDKKTPLALSREELVALRQLMRETATQLRLPKDKTELLVHTMVGKLAIAES